MMLSLRKKTIILSRGMDAGFLGFLDVESSEEKGEPGVDRYLELWFLRCV